MTDYFQNDNRTSSPARLMWAVTPHNANPISPLPKALRFNAAGQVTLRAVDSTEDVVINVAAGEILSVRARFVRATGTTATGIHAFS